MQDHLEAGYEFTCPVCPKIMDTRSNLYSHLRTAPKHKFDVKMRDLDEFMRKKRDGGGPSRNGFGLQSRPQSGPQSSISNGRGPQSRPQIGPQSSTSNGRGPQNPIKKQTSNGNSNVKKDIFNVSLVSSDENDEDDNEVHLSVEESPQRYHPYIT